MGIRDHTLLLREVEPAVEPLTLAETKLYLRVDGSDEDSLINNLIVSVREQAESYTRRSLITQDWLLALNDCARSLERLPKGPVQQVLSVQTVSRSGVVTVIDSDHYSILAAKDAVEFSVIPLGHRVEIRYRTGYGGALTDVPEALRLGMLEHVAALYDARGNLERLPSTVRQLYLPYRVVRM